MKKEKHRSTETPAPSTPPSDSSKSTAYRCQDGYAAPTAEERHEAAVLAEAKRLGYRLAVQCTRCNQWVVAAKSVAAHMGPTCRARAGEQ